MSHSRDYKWVKIVFKVVLKVLGVMSDLEAKTNTMSKPVHTTMQQNFMKTCALVLVHFT